MWKFFAHPNAPIFCALALLVSVNVLVWSIVVHLQKPLLRVVFLDVGQGDAIFIEAPGGRQMLIDGGPDRSVLRALSREMSFFDRTIDVVLATHPDKDHVFGLASVLSRYTVSYLIDPGVPNDTSFWEAYADAMQREGASNLRGQRGMVVRLGNGVDFHVLFPDRDLSGVSDTNTASIVGKLTFGNTAFMLTGDSPESIERYLVARDSVLLASDVLKVGHHGSRTSTSDAFVEAVHPQYAVVSAGEDNSYGHPHQDVVARLQSVGARILGTYEDGSIRFVSNGVSLSVR